MNPRATGPRANIVASNMGMSGVTIGVKSLKKLISPRTMTVRSFFRVASSGTISGADVERVYA
jgi:hypothetical protein